MAYGKPKNKLYEGAVRKMEWQADSDNLNVEKVL
jgi:hypothetical protein